MYGNKVNLERRGYDTEYILNKVKVAGVKYNQADNIYIYTQCTGCLMQRKTKFIK